jgi:hypothetical protein
MDKSEELDLRKAFAKPGAKLRFRRLAGFDYVSDEDVEEMIAINDGVAFRDGLLNGREPAFEVEAEHGVRPYLLSAEPKLA